MQNNPTQNNTAKKQWQKPDCYIVGINDINTGNVMTSLESFATPKNGTGAGQTNTTNFTRANRLGFKRFFKYYLVFGL